jgi:hypothetical protein
MTALARRLRPPATGLRRRLPKSVVLHPEPHPTIMNTTTRLLLALAASLATSCVTTIPIRSTQPGPVALGGTNHLVLVKGEGRRSAREVLAQQVAQQGRAGGYFSCEDRSEDPVFAKVAGGRVVLEDDEGVVAGTEKTGVKIDVLEWTSERTTQEVKSRDKTGKEVVRQVPVHQGMVLLAVTVFDGSGRAFLAEKEYRGEYASQDLDVTKEQVVEQASAQAIARFLADITPVQVVTRVRLDDDDPQQESILATAKAGNVAQAAQDAQKYAEANPNNPTAAYNLAVFLDAMGRYRDAIAWYDRAIAGGTKSYYAEARAECARRMAGQESLSATPQQ